MSHWLDDAARGLAQGRYSRRHVLRRGVATAGGAFVGSLVGPFRGLLSPALAFAAVTCAGRTVPCKAGEECCPGLEGEEICYDPSLEQCCVSSHGVERGVCKQTQHCCGHYCCDRHNDCCPGHPDGCCGYTEKCCGGDTCYDTTLEYCCGDHVCARHQHCCGPPDARRCCEGLDVCCGIGAAATCCSPSDCINGMCGCPKGEVRCGTGADATCCARHNCHDGVCHAACDSTTYSCGREPTVAKPGSVCCIAEGATTGVCCQMGTANVKYEQSTCANDGNGNPNGQCCPPNLVTSPCNRGTPTIYKCCPISLNGLGGCCEYPPGTYTCCGPTEVCKVPAPFTTGPYGCV